PDTCSFSRTWHPSLPIGSRSPSPEADSMQILIVSLIVAVAACYAAWQLLPKPWLQWLLGRALKIAPGHAWLQPLAARVEESGCAGCKACPPEPANGDKKGARPIRFHRTLKS